MLSDGLRRRTIVNEDYIQEVPNARKKTSLSGRDRAEGWTHAKRSGHMHESDIAARLQSDLAFANGLSIRCFNETLGRPIEVSGGGTSAERVEDLFGSRTNGKPDLYVKWSAQRAARISLKKSMGGQVFLTSVARFVTGFEKQFGIHVPEKVRMGLDLFIGGSESQLREAMKGRRFCGPIHRRTGVSQEEHQSRLLGVTLEEHFSSEWAATLTWFAANIGDIAEFAFARGYAIRRTDFATHVWYLEPSHAPRFDLVVPVAQIKVCASRKRDEVRVGSRNGGSTIQLPFGFLQMHAPQSKNLMQFHHNYKKVKALVG
jgi:hypothetical protein